MIGRRLLRGARRVVREQREEGVRIPAVGWDEIDAGGVYVHADDYRDLAFELQRLQAAVMGEPPPGP